MKNIENAECYSVRGESKLEHKLRFIDDMKYAIAAMRIRPTEQRTVYQLYMFKGREWSMDSSNYIIVKGEAVPAEYVLDQTMWYHVNQQVGDRVEEINEENRESAVKNLMRKKRLTFDETIKVLVWFCCLAQGDLSSLQKFFISVTVLPDCFALLLSLIAFTIDTINFTILIIVLSFFASIIISFF